MKRAIVIVVSLMLCSCAARQVVNTYQGSTAQRLVTTSIDKAISDFPIQDLNLMRGRPVFLEFNYLHYMQGHEYFFNRLVSELRRRGVLIVDNPADADMVLSLFCTSVGTDNTYNGIETPEIPLIVGSIPRIKILGVDLFRGVSEYYYFLQDKSQIVNIRSETIQGSSKTDQYQLLFISFTRKNM